MEAAAFGSYGLTKGLLQNFRRENDGWNEFAGGVSGGIVWGAFSNLFPIYLFNFQDVNVLRISSL